MNAVIELSIADLPGALDGGLLVGGGGITAGGGAIGGRGALSNDIELELLIIGAVGIGDIFSFCNEIDATGGGGIFGDLSNDIVCFGGEPTGLDAKND